MLYSLAQGEVGDGVGSGTELMGTLTSGNVKWNGFMEGGIPAVSVETIQSILGYINEKSAYSEGQEQDKWKEKMTWFGQGGVYVIDGEAQLVVAGAYNPEMLRRIGIWESGGLDALMMEVYGRSLLKVDGKPIPKDEIEKFMNSLTENEKIIWSGGEIYSMDFNDFQAAVGGLEEKYLKINSKGVSIQGIVYAEGREEE